VTAAALEQAWTALVRQRGPLVEIAEAEPTTVQGFRGTILTAQFARGRQRIRVLFDAAGGAVGFQYLPPAAEPWSPPSYAGPDAVEEREVTVASPSGCSLPARLALPSGGDAGDALAGVVVVAGSGPTDMDGTIGPNRPYKDLAWGLAARGVASLRYDKRTLACQVDPATLTIDDEVTADARAAVARLREAARVASDRVAVVGHSLGGMLTPRIAAREAEAGTPLAGAALLAAPARPLHDLILAQTRYLAELDGTVTGGEEANLAEVRAAVERIEALEIGDDETVLGAGRAYWESLRAYDPVTTAAGLSTPLFLGQGERDYQVTVAEDLARWRDGLGEGPRIETYPRLNHLFVPGEGQPGPAEYFDPGHVAEVVVADLEGWLAAATGGGATTTTATANG
jgi:hypothetical protein